MPSWDKASIFSHIFLKKQKKASFFMAKSYFLEDISTLLKTQKPAGITASITYLHA